LKKKEEWVVQVQRVAVVNKLAIALGILGALGASEHDGDDESGYKTPPPMKAPQNSPALKPRGEFEVPFVPTLGVTRSPLGTRPGIGPLTFMSVEELEAEEKAIRELMAKSRLK